ncbi:MAG: NADH-quinone oxidoreductase subunit L [Actinomycetota bacterium]|nr:NADH-quinone oxidoreductase subunit L [Actinomycetota bacterium]
MTALVIVGAPLLAAVVGLLVGGRSRQAAAGVAVVGTAAVVVLAGALLAGQPWSDPQVGDGLTGPWQLLPFATIVDGLSASVALMVGVVALMVQVYSVGYMRDDARYASYSSFISLFTAAMLAVVVAGDLLFLVVGWEVMGLCSYLLIGHYWERAEARAAAVKAFLVTKLGDVGFILGVIVLAVSAGSFMIPAAVEHAAAANSTATTVAVLLLFVGVMGKSAQFPLHAWLPDAMAGPSPVSALIHAATMVAAGVYVVIRLYPAFFASGAAMAVLAVVGSLTMFGAALAALAQEDLKRVLAWSTVSQLAYMVAALGVGSREAATFHLLTHAFFKSLLFLGAGVVIHAVGSNLMRDMGGLRRALPVTFWTMTIGLFSLAGAPPLAGWFSKESILVAAERAAEGEAGVAVWTGWLVLVTAVVTVAVTAAYVVRVWARVFLGSARGAPEPHPAPALMRWPLVVLAVPAAGLGFLGLRAGWLPTWSFPTVTAPPGAVDEVTALRPGLLTVALSLLALVVGAAAVWRVWRSDPSSDPADRLGGVRAVFEDGFGVDTAYRALAVVPFESAVRVVGAADDRVVVRTVSGVGQLTLDVSDEVQGAQRGNVQRYLTVAAAFVIAAVVILVVAVTT